MTNQVKAFLAYSGSRSSVVADTPSAAALLFFEKNPRARKCDIIEGVTDGHFFTVAYGRASEGRWPKSFKDVTKKQAATVGDE